MGKNQSMNYVMERCRIKIWNAAEDEVISTRIAPFGYTAEKMDSLKNLYNETEALFAKQKQETGEWRNASDAFSNAKGKALTDFKSIRNKLKFFYPSTSHEATKLELYRDDFSRYADFVSGAKYFYQTLLKNAEVISRLLPFGYTEESISSLAEDINSLDGLKEARERESGDAQVATQERNTKLDELEEACNELTRLAKLIFEDNEAQYLEKLGILVRS